MLYPVRSLWFVVYILSARDFFLPEGETFSFTCLKQSALVGL